jgi:hypothetical protein
MKNQNIGVFILPTTVNQGTASYSIPGLIKKDRVEDMYFSITSPQEHQNISEIESDEDKVTHEVFFGENISRVIKTLFTK